MGASRGGARARPARRGAATPRGSAVGARARPLLAFAAAMARGRAGPAARALDAARAAGTPRRAAEETALMLVLHAGYPAALEAARLLAARWPGRARRTREGGPTRWMRRGERLARRVYGASYPRLRRNVRALHPDLDRWMIEQGYGRVLGRGGLAAATRELVAVAVLAALGWERQLVSHLLGAARTGVPKPAIRAAWSAGRRVAAPAARAALGRAWHAAFAPARV